MSNRDIFSAMQEGKPVATYQNTILGKVYITALDPFSDSPKGYILEGDPKKKDDKTFIDVWSEKEDLFFKRMNKFHFETGNIIKVVREEIVEEKAFEQYSDEELKEVINTPFMSLRNSLNKMSSVATVYRVLNLAQEMEKSDKIVKAIQARLSELQSAPITEEDSK